MPEDDVRTARNNETGETVKFKWHEQREPTESDIGAVFQEHEAQKVTKAQTKTGAPTPVKPSVSEQYGDSALGKVAEFLPKTEKFNPLIGLTQALDSARFAATGKMPPASSGIIDPTVSPGYYAEREREQKSESPRLAGVRGTIGGLMTAAGPLIGTGGKMLQGLKAFGTHAIPGLAAGFGAQALADKYLPDTMDPELKGIISDLTGLTVGMGTGKVTGKMFGGKVTPVEEKVMAPIDGGGEPPPPGGPSGPINRPLPEQATAARPPGPVGPPVVNRPLAQPVVKPPVQRQPLSPDLAPSQPRVQPPVQPDVAAAQQLMAQKLATRQAGQVTPPEAPPGPPINQPLPPQATAPRPPVLGQVTPVNRPLNLPEIQQPLPPRQPLAPGLGPSEVPSQEAVQPDVAGAKALMAQRLAERVANRPEKPVEVPGPVTSPTVRRDANGRFVKSEKLETPAVDVPEKVVAKAQEAIKPVTPVVKTPKKPTPIIGPPPNEIQAQADALHVDPYEIPPSPEKVTPSAAPEVPEPKAPEKVKVSEEQAEQTRKYDNFLKTTERYKSTKDPEKLISVVAKQAKEVGHGVDELREDLEDAKWEKGHIEKAIQEAFPDEVGYKKPKISERRRKSSRGSISLKPRETIPGGDEPPGAAMQVVHSLSPSDQYLSDIPEFKPHVDKVKEIKYNQVMPFKYDQGQKVAAAMKGFDKSKGKELVSYMQGIASKDPQVQATGDKLRLVMQDLYTQLKNHGHASPDPVNYIRDLVDHMGANDTFGGKVKESFEPLLGKKADDPIAIMRRMIDNTADVIYKRAPYLEAKKEIANMPDSFEKEMGQEYWDTFAGVGPKETKGSQVLGNLGKFASRVTQGSVLGLSPGLQVLHMARIFTQGMPEIGAKWVMKGFAESAGNRKAAFDRAVRSGLVPDRVIPKSIRTKGENYDNFMNLGDIGNTTAKVVMHEANRAKFKAQGDPNWEHNAVRETARQEGMADDTSTIPLLKAMNPMFAQYRSFALRYGYQVLKPLIAGISQGDKAQILKAAKLIGYGAAAYEASEQSGIRLYHWHPSSAFRVSANQIRAAQNLARHAEAGDIDNVIIDFIKEAPLGQRVMKRDETGEVNFHPENAIDVTNRPMSEILRDYSN